MLDAPPDRWLIQSEDGTRFWARVAADRGLRTRAYRLAWKIYERSGYAPEDGGGLLVSSCDAHAQSLTLLIENEAGQDLATISLLFDSLHGLPSDDIYLDDLFSYRLAGRRLVEVSRLAMDDRQPHSKTLLTSLFNLIVIFARDVQKCTDFVIEVNPRHVEYYRRLLLFEVIGEERPCPRVQHAPAVLLRLNLATTLAVRTNPGGAGLERVLYRRFYGPADEARAAAFLAANHKPMSATDAAFFGLRPAREHAESKECIPA